MKVGITLENLAFISKVAMIADVETGDAAPEAQGGAPLAAPPATGRQLGKRQAWHEGLTTRCDVNYIHYWEFKI